MKAIWFYNNNAEVEIVGSDEKINNPHYEVTANKLTITAGAVDMNTGIRIDQSNKESLTVNTNGKNLLLEGFSADSSSTTHVNYAKLTGNGLIRFQNEATINSSFAAKTGRTNTLELDQNGAAILMSTKTLELNKEMFIVND